MLAAAGGGWRWGGADCAPTSSRSWAPTTSAPLGVPHSLGGRRACWGTPLSQCGKPDWLFGDWEGKQFREMEFAVRKRLLQSELQLKESASSRAGVLLCVKELGLAEVPLLRFLWHFFLNLPPNSGFVFAFFFSFGNIRVTLVIGNVLRAPRLRFYGASPHLKVLIN